VKRKVLVVALILSALAGCAPQDSNYSIPPCDEVSDALVLEAQSVPTAAKLPCLGPLPEGWSRGRFETRDGRTEFVLDSDRAGISAVTVVLADSCDFSGSDEVLSDEPGARKWSRIGDLRGEDTDVISYVFSGGCVQYEFDFEGDLRTALEYELTNSLSFVNRNRIAAEVAELGLQLDPDDGGN
jgi:hypothetical protein